MQNSLPNQSCHFKMIPFKCVKAERHMPTTRANRDSISSIDIYRSSPAISPRAKRDHTYRLCSLILQDLRDEPHNIFAIHRPHYLPLLFRFEDLRKGILGRTRDLSIWIVKGTPPRSNTRFQMLLETASRESGEGRVRRMRAETHLPVKVRYQRRIKRDLHSISKQKGASMRVGTQMPSRASRVWPSMSAESLAGRSKTALERVVGSRFWMFLRMTTRSGGSADRSRGLVVEERGDEGVKAANEPREPKSETEPNGELEA